jgi:hypothetical protein
MILIAAHSAAVLRAGPGRSSLGWPLSILGHDLETFRQRSFCKYLLSLVRLRYVVGFTGAIQRWEKVTTTARRARRNAVR